MGFSVSRTVVLGNVGANPKTHTLESGVKVSQFSLATTESYLDKNTGEYKDITEWHNITAWRHLADLVEKYVKTGSKVYIEGKNKTTKSTDKNGIDRWNTNIVAKEIILMNNTGEGKNTTPVPSEEDAPKQGKKKSKEGDDVDDLPF